MAKESKFQEKWRLFLDSFRLKSSFLYVILYDLLFYVITIPLFILFPWLLNKKLAGIDPEILSRITSTALTNITAAQTKELEMAVQSMQNFFAFFIIGIIFLAIASLLVFTLSRALIWNFLLKKKFEKKSYFKFNVLNVLLAVIFAVIIFILARLRTLIVMPLVSASVLFAFIVTSLLFLLIFVAIIYFVNLVYLNYTEKSNVLGSFGATFELIKNRFLDIYPSYLFMVMVSIVISLVAQIFWLFPFAIQRYFNFAVFILFAAWMRIYILRVIKNE
ncbi:hypothetical protein KY342_04300 [Candidatus Woesearchaeota archaeon]|nr:hypothetical protein [Candidatus Woesearchaeota archaeon]